MLWLGLDYLLSVDKNRVRRGRKATFPYLSARPKQAISPSGRLGILPRFYGVVSDSFNIKSKEEVLALSQPQPAPYYSPAPKKQYWTAGKILGLILGLLVIGGAVGLAYNYNINRAAPLFSDFTISATTPQATSAGTSSNSSITVTGTGGFGAAVTLSATTPSGLNCNSLGTVTPGNPFLLVCSSNTSGTYPMNIVATSGTLTHSVSISFTYTKPTSVPLSGTVTTVGSGTSPTTIQFGYYSTSATGGTYSITLPNPGTYQVYINWIGYLGVTGSCYAGYLTLNQDSTAKLTQNYEC